MIHVKVCCIQDHREAELAARHGASALGLVSEMPSGPGVIAEERIAEIVAGVSGSVATVLLTSETDPDRIIDQQRRCGVDALQLIDRVELSVYERLRSGLPGVRLIQVVHVTGPEAVDDARRLAALVDELLLDTGRPSAEVRELGGTGRTHDWRLSRAIRERVDVPVWLAGGLDPDNVGEAVRTVEPYGVDVCSGLRPSGELDEGLLARFVRAVDRGGSRRGDSQPETGRG